MKCCPKYKCISTVNSRTDLFHRGTKNALVTDFFGSVRKVNYPFIYYLIYEIFTRISLLKQIQLAENYLILETYEEPIKKITPNE